MSERTIYIQYLQKAKSKKLGDDEIGKKKMREKRGE